jgi:hypothetical protein
MVWLKRGFDSIAQAACGIAMAESPTATRPGSLPCQLLDHGTGYLAPRRPGGRWATAVRNRRHASSDCHRRDRRVAAQPARPGNSRAAARTLSAGQRLPDHAAV